jgi:hypothetical protein
MAPPPDMQPPAAPSPDFAPSPPPDMTPPAPPSNPCPNNESHCETHSSSSSSSFGFSFGPSGGPPGWGPPGWGPPPPTPDQLVGKWTLGQTNSGASCALTLYGKPDGFGLRRAWTNVGCPDGFFNTARWRIAGRDVQLTDLMGNPIGTFHMVGPGQLEGYRVSDHARLYLSR